MADLTLSECKSCQHPYSCCSPEYCEFSIGFAHDRGVELQRTGHPRLPMMGPAGCVVPPHLRPMCTMHTCDVNAVGFKKPGNNPIEAEAWTKAYFDMRSEIEIEELKLMGFSPKL